MRLMHKLGLLLFITELHIPTMKGFGKMLFEHAASNFDYSVFTLRRKDLLNQVKEQYPDITNGLIVLFGAFEHDSRAFHQDNSFYYYSGIEEPGAVITIDLSGKTALFVPNCQEERSKWMFSDVEFTQKNAAKLGFDTIELLGSACAGYQLHPFFPKEEYNFLIAFIQKIVDKQGVVFTLNPTNTYEHIEPRLVFQRLQSFIPEIPNVTKDISPIVGNMRRRKDMREIDLLYKAIEITAEAQYAAAEAIKDSIRECEVQAALEYIITSSGARIAFPSIVASGKNATVLHYLINKAVMKQGDLVVVDIGAEYNYYCADITRTYPVSGKFTDRQREIYSLVLETQEHIASLAKPGMWLRNSEKPEQSLHHIAKKYLDDRGYGKYFPHGIGHYLGLDVHDVGSYKTPLQEGDVITIEPGIYIPEEEIGIRIEDDYWIVKDGAVCLSEHLPKKPDQLEKMMEQSLFGQTSDDNFVTMLDHAINQEVEH